MKRTTLILAIVLFPMLLSIPFDSKSAEVIKGEIVELEYPSQVNNGEEIPIKITVKNTGDVVWFRWCNFFNSKIGPYTTFEGILNCWTEAATPIQLNPGETKSCETSFELEESDKDVIFKGVIAACNCDSSMQRSTQTVDSEQFCIEVGNPSEDCSLTTSIPTTTCKEDDPCCTEEIYGEYSEETEFLRYFRDNVLTQTPEGQEIIRLYYEWSPVIVKAMKEDEEFKQDVKEMVDGVLLLLTREE